MTVADDGRSMFEDGKQELLGEEQLEQLSKYEEHGRELIRQQMEDQDA